MTELPLAPPALVDFVLRHLRVQATHGSLQDVRDGYVLAPRTIVTYNLIYTTRGKPVWVIADKGYRLAPGRLLLVPPHQPHHGYSTTKRMTLVSLHVHAHLPGSGGREVFELLALPEVQDVQPGCPLDRYLRGMMAEYDRFPRRPGDGLAGDLVNQTLPAWAQLIVPEMIRQAAAQRTLRHRWIDPLIAEVLGELNRRAGEPVTLTQIASIAGFSPQHLNRVFGRVLGVTPLKYLARIRMERAAALLAEGRWTVRAVARQVGIDDPYYFSRLFRRHFGQSPDQYRRGVDATAGGRSDNPS